MQKPERVMTDFDHSDETRGVGSAVVGAGVVVCGLVVVAAGVVVCGLVVVAAGVVV